MGFEALKKEFLLMKKRICDRAYRLLINLI